MLLLFIFIIPKVEASTSSVSSYVLIDETTVRVPLSKDKDSKRLITYITKIITATLTIEPGSMKDTVAVGDEIKKTYGLGDT